jgi:hypothetical protein
MDRPNFCVAFSSDLEARAVEHQLIDDLTAHTKERHIRRSAWIMEAIREKLASEGKKVPIKVTVVEDVEI